MDEVFCSPLASSLSLLQRRVISHSIARSLHLLFRMLKPIAEKSCTEKAVSSSGLPAWLGTERGGQPGRGGNTRF